MKINKKLIGIVTGVSVTILGLSLGLGLGLQETKKNYSFPINGKNYTFTSVNNKLYAELENIVLEFGTPKIALPAFDNVDKLDGPVDPNDEKMKYVFNIPYAGIGNVLIRNDGKVWRLSNVEGNGMPQDSVSVMENGMAYIPLDWVDGGPEVDGEAKTIPFKFFNFGNTLAESKIRLATNTKATTLDNIGAGFTLPGDFINVFPKDRIGDDENQPLASTTRTNDIEFKIRELKAKNASGDFVGATVTLEKTLTSAHGLIVRYKANDLYYPIQVTKAGETELLFYGNVSPSVQGVFTFNNVTYRIKDKQSLVTIPKVKFEWPR